jgi:hypothetical protein
MNDAEFANSLLSALQSVTHVLNKGEPVFRTQHYIFTEISRIPSKIHHG